MGLWYQIESLHLQYIFPSHCKVMVVNYLFTLVFKMYFIFSVSLCLCILYFWVKKHSYVLWVFWTYFIKRFLKANQQQQYHNPHHVNPHHQTSPHHSHTPPYPHHPSPSSSISPHGSGTPGPGGTISPRLSRRSSHSPAMAGGAGTPSPSRLHPTPPPPQMNSNIACFGHFERELQYRYCFR